MKTLTYISVAPVLLMAAGTTFTTLSTSSLNVLFICIDDLRPEPFFIPLMQQHGYGHIVNLSSGY